MQYIQDITFINDLKIIFQTLVKVFKKEDISTEGMETAEDLGDYLLRTHQISQQEYDKVIRTTQTL